MVEVSDDRDGQRLDNFLMYVLNNVPKTRIYRIIRKGEVRVNGKRAKPDTKLIAEDVVRVPPVSDATKQIDTVSVDSNLEWKLTNAILFEDESLIAINKPSGLAVHGGSGLKLGLIEALRSMRPEGEFYELVHRLDRDTSGVVLIAKKRKALTVLQNEFRAKHSVQKTYWCLVGGQWPVDRTKIDAPLLRHEESSSGERRVSVHHDGKPSQTKFRILKSSSTLSWIEAMPITGRTHQIRVHCLYAGHPILGDDKYQDEASQQMAKKIKLKRLFLHAAQLVIPHPVTGHMMTFKADIEPKLQAILRNEI